MNPLYKVHMPQDIENKIGALLQSGQLAYGDQTRLFEKKLQDYIQNPNTLCISENAVLFALKLINIQHGDEVIISPMCCLATTQPIAYLGAKVVWADIDPTMGSLCPDDVISKITPKTKAIIHYHWGGNLGYIDEINSIAEEKGIYVIEDATEAFGGVYKTKMIGNNGTDIVCYSFTPVRLPNSIDGGGLSITNDSLYEDALLLRDYGIDRSRFRDKQGEISDKCDVATIGIGCTMNNLSGYIGQVQMEYIEALFNTQRRNASQWDSFFYNDNTAKALKKHSYATPSYWVYTILCEDRDRKLNEMRDKGFYASKMHCRNDIYSVFGSKENAKRLKGVDEFSRKQLNIPCGWWVKNI